MLPSFISVDEIKHTVATALAEDIGSGDLTAALIPTTTQAQAHVICRETATLCGQAWFNQTFAQLDPTISITWQYADGDALVAHTTLCHVVGPARPILTGERTALNFLQMLSGTATLTQRYANAIASTGCKILDTRKTVPGLRRAQKYAVLCGGGSNHRLGLFDAVLVKENHIAAAGSIALAVAHARSIAGKRLVEVEVENLLELEQALNTDIDRVLLDNFDLATLTQAVQLRQAHHRTQIKLEASGNVSLETVQHIAATGVDFISVGSLTKHVQAIDLSMRF